MRLFRSVTLLLALVAPSVFADDLYQVEMILVRQNAVPAIVSRAAPEDWDAGAKRIDPDSFRTPSLNPEVEKLTASNEYTVLLHKAWQQTLGENASKVAISDGKEQFGQFPIEGTLEMKLGRFTDVNADFWVNQIDANGMVDVLKMQPIARMGYYEYTTVDNKFQMVIPGSNKALLAGLEGSPDKTQQATRAR